MGSVTAQAARFFRYVDDSGKLVLSHTIPADRVRNGYEIVDEHSRVIQVVKPQLTPEEYAAKLELEASQLECRRALRRVKNLYRFQEDIDRAEEQEMASIATHIANTKANLAAVRTQKNDLERQAAQLDLAGRAISTELLANIDAAAAQEENLEQEIELRYQEQIDKRREYDNDRVVFELRSCEEGLPASIASVGD